MSGAPIAALLVLLSAAGGCGESPREGPNERPHVRGAGEPRRVLLDRILITYRGNPFGIDARRTPEEARRLAHSIAERARAGEDFAELRDGYSDDRTPQGVARGQYVLMNFGVPIGPWRPDIPRLLREAMGPRLGDVVFSMHVGEIAVVEYDPDDYPLGFEVVRCLMRDDRTEEQVAEDLKKPAK